MKILILTLSIFSLDAFAAGGFESFNVANGKQKTYPTVEKYSYQCAESDTLKESGSQDWKTNNDIKYSGTEEYTVLDAQNSVSVEVDEFGRSITKIKVEELTTDTKKKTFETEYASLDGQYTSKSVGVRVVKIVNGVETIISNEVDGQAKPVSWTIYQVELDERTSISTAVHNQPGLRNKNGTEYSRIVQSCIYTKQ